MLNPATVIPAANAYLPTLIDTWVQKELYGICQTGVETPTLGYLTAYLNSLVILNCSTLNTTQQQCLLQFVSPPQC